VGRKKLISRQRWLIPGGQPYITKTTMKKLLIVLLLFSLKLSAQEKIAEGFILNRLDKQPVAHVEVTETKEGSSTLSDSLGYFELNLPKRTRYLTLQHKDYRALKVPLRPPRKKYELKLELMPFDQKLRDSTWLSHKNAIMFSPAELMVGAVAFRYERFLKDFHSIGLHTSVYLYGYDSFYNPFNRYYPAWYQGIKLTPFYRFYPVRTAEYGFFLEGKIPFGHFNFHDLRYYRVSYDDDVENIPQSFWTVGAAIALGWSFGFPKLNHGIANLSLGLQYFPFNAPLTIETYGQEGELITYESDVFWWYFNSAGAVVEIKFTLGGIF
jgi:hypothetical protein